MSFSADTERREGLLILHGRGKITIGAGDSELRRITLATARSERGVILDCAAVTTIDSSGVGELFGVQTTFLNRDIMFAIASPPQKLVELLIVTGLIEALLAFRTVDEAVAVLAPLSFAAFIQRQNEWTDLMHDKLISSSDDIRVQLVTPK